MSKKFALLHCFVAVLILGISQGISNFWYYVDFKGMESILFAVTYVGLTFFLLQLYLKFVAKKDFAFFGVTSFHIQLKWLLIAFVLPLAVLAALFLWVPGKFYTNNFSLSILLEAIFGTGLAVGIVEEIVFRGIIMHAVAACSSKKVGILLPSLLFGCLHLLNGELNLASALLLIVGGTVVGIMFSLITYANASIWPSALVHGVWNALIIGGIVNFGIEKNNFAISGYVFKTDNIFLTGGEFGVEVSIFAILGYLCVIAYCWMLLRKCKQQT